MGNPFGIALNPAWTEWAAKQGVSETVAAALYLLSENRRAEEVVGKLTPGELERVIDVVGRQLDCFPRGTLAALEDSRCTSPKASARSSRRGGGGNPYGITLNDKELRWAAAEGVPESVIAAICLLHERSVEEIAARLTTTELEQVIKIAWRSPQIYPPGAYAALKEERDRRSMQRSAARSPGARISPRSCADA